VAVLLASCSVISAAFGYSPNGTYAARELADWEPHLWDIELPLDHERADPAKTPAPERATEILPGLVLCPAPVVSLRNWPKVYGIAGPRPPTNPVRLS
jgi:hypothetical protein